MQQSLAPYLHQRATGRAFALLKTAMSLDGRTAAADGSSQWITSVEARADAHRLRAESQAVVAALCIGVALAIGTIVVVAQLRALASNPRSETVVSRLVVSSVSLLAGPIPTARPPTPLRI